MSKTCNIFLIIYHKPESRVSRNSSISFEALNIWSRKTKCTHWNVCNIKKWTIDFCHRSCFLCSPHSFFLFFYLQPSKSKWLLYLIIRSGEWRTLADSPWPSSHLPSFNSLEYFWSILDAGFLIDKIIRHAWFSCFFLSFTSNIGRWRRKHPKLLTFLYTNSIFAIAYK